MQYVQQKTGFGIEIELIWIQFQVYFFGESSKKSAYKEDLQRIEESKHLSPQSQVDDDQLNSARSAKLDLIGFEESNPTLNASFIGDIETVKAGLEQKGFDPNYRCNVNGFTALMLASQEGHYGTNIIVISVFEIAGW